MPLDSADALARILRQGDIAADPETIAAFDQGLLRARRFFDIRNAGKLDKHQSIALNRLIAEDPDGVLALDWDSNTQVLLGLLYRERVNNLDGRTENPVTALIIDLTELYFQLKGVRQ